MGSARPPKLLVAGAVVLVANSAYLAAVAAPTLFFYANVALLYGLKARHRWTGGASIGWILFLAAAASGIWLAYLGASRANQRVLYAHAAVAALSVLFAAAWLDRVTARTTSRTARRLATSGVLLL